MADIKISALPTATTPLTGAELVPIVQSGVTKQTTTSDVLAVPVTSLTASSAVATDASKKLVSVANTGTGDNVLATSPTLVAPALGTPASGVVTNLTGTASININGTVGATTPAAVSATSLTDSGNLTFTNTGNRITGDFSNATIANRVLFQTSTANTSTIVQTIPSGTGTVARWNLANSSDPANASEASFAATSTEVRVESTLRGTGTYLPMTFYTGGSERVRVDTSGNVGVGKTPVAGRGLLQVNGDAEVTSLNTGQLAGLRNRVINGDMRVAQRGAISFTGNMSSYGGADRWSVATASFTTLSSLLTQSGSLGSGVTSTGYVQAFGSVTTTGSGTITFIQRIEAQNAASLNGKTVTISGKLYQDTGATLSPTVNIYKPTGGVDNYSSNAFVGGAAVSVTTGIFTSFSVQVTLGAADASNGLQLSIIFSVGAVTGKYFQIGDIQLELGSTATPFEQRPYGMELALCQRYYYRIYPGAVNKPLTAFSQGYSTTLTIAIFNFPVTMRISPTALEQSGTANQYSVFVPGTGEIACSAVPNLQNSITNISSSIGFTVASGLTQFAWQYPITNSTNGAGAYLGWSAEL